MAKKTGITWGRWRRVAAWVVGLPIVGAVASAVVLNPTNFLAGLRALPGEVRQTSNQFWSWYHDDAAWTGYWSNDPEGYVNAADMGLSTEVVALDLLVKNGEIDGTISTKAICDATPFNDFFLVRGNVSGGETATVVVWDTFQGRNANIAQLELKRDGVMMTVVPMEGTVRLFPKEARVAINPNEPDGNDRGEFCEGKAEAVANALSRITKNAPVSASANQSAP